METAIEAEADMNCMFDHLFDDENIESAPAVINENDAVTETNTTNRPSSEEHTEMATEKQPALLMAHESTLKVVRKMKSFTGTPLVEKAIAAKK